ncbi:hypothetical protein [Planctomyces sp. SH-PL62]|uniref:hypothetical protein n=1 Tax=Planctomyces sp. SH-PL62 TaxID=1636152 RepID=UPI00078B1C94|nr:hypothetical protein [Planctomyces sp. SH-PL62]AMV37618.1 hypothetical protein VT85_09285 [Planctomyces sp. SH-PL62]
MARTNRRTLILRFAPVLLLIAVPAAAAPIRYDFGGVLTQAEASTGVAPGTRFTGSFTYDDAALPVQSFEYPNSRGDFAQYVFGAHRLPDGSTDGSGIELRIDGGPTVRSEGDLTIDSWSTMRPEYRPSPAIELHIRSDLPDYSKGPDYGVSIFLEGQQRVVWPGDPVPADLALSDFPKAKVYLLGRLPERPDGWLGEPPSPDSNVQLAVGEIDFLTATPVPEPAWTVAALLGAAAWAARRRASR